jgi:hypothetical protein
MIVAGHGWVSFVAYRGLVFMHIIRATEALTGLPAKPACDSEGRWRTNFIPEKS